MIEDVPQVWAGEVRELEAGFGSFSGVVFEPGVWAAVLV